MFWHRFSIMQMLLLLAYVFLSNVILHSFKNVLKGMFYYFYKCVCNLNKVGRKDACHYFFGKLGRCIVVHSTYLRTMCSIVEIMYHVENMNYTDGWVQHLVITLEYNENVFTFFLDRPDKSFIEHAHSAIIAFLLWTIS